MAASDDTLFVVVGDTCTALDAATGEIRHEFKALQSNDGIPRHWGYVAQDDCVLYGTSTIRSELASTLRRRGRKVGGSTDGIFAFDTESKKQLWSYQGKNIMHVTITIGDGRMYFIESSISPEERDALLRQDKTELKKLEGEARAKKEAELKSLDVRRVVALDAKSGEELWRKPVDVTFVSGVSAGGANDHHTAPTTPPRRLGANASRVQACRVTPRPRSSPGPPRIGAGPPGPPRPW